MAVQQQINKFVQGIGASPGIVVGKAYLVERLKVRLPQKQIDPAQVEKEVKRFLNAIQESQNQLAEIKEKILDPEVRKHSFILDVHLMILKDEMLLQDTVDAIRKRKVNAEWALDLTLEKLDTAFKAIEDEYLRERLSDLHYVAARIFRNLLGRKHDDITQIKGKVIVVAHDLSPADTLQMNLEHVAGFITDIGGKVSHTAILSRSLGIPAVVGLQVATSLINGGDLLIIDGETGEVVINPTEGVSKSFLERKRRTRLIEREILKYASLPAETRDGVRVRLQANIEMVEEISSAKMHGAEGIGLYRTEIIYLNRKDLPTEEEHFQAYRRLVEDIYPATSTIRTLDIGGDKFLPNYSKNNELNPALGLRAIRFSLRETEIFRTQLRGILRASAYGKLRILFPMISGIEEIRQAKAILEEAKKSLARTKIPFDEKVGIGAMIEIPSASDISDILAREVDFFSIGTNDLIQYALAVDRINEHVSYLYEPLHPAVLRIIRWVVQSGHQAGIPVAICGEMAAEPIYAVVLLGLGLDEFSMNPTSIPKVKKVLRMSRFEETRSLVEQLFQFPTASEIERFVRNWMAKRFPEEVIESYPEEIKA
ncbi:MAG TPA: phosphoenolpyruvate--protein phosphotransferase [Thermodesulfobacteriota bacterium]|jgi:phosphotransferase system enzyme I (PtsI)|nr:phosphoenolpyruvate--protein phosphotransferase [Thermodesulfobacteriota bacterium]